MNFARLCIHYVWLMYTYVLTFMCGKNQILVWWWWWKRIYITWCYGSGLYGMRFPKAILSVAVCVCRVDAIIIEYAVDMNIIICFKLKAPFVLKIIIPTIYIFTLTLILFIRFVYKRIIYMLFYMLNTHNEKVWFELTSEIEIRLM